MNIVKKELSILIPTYNYDPSPLVSSLQVQAERLTAAGLQYEIIVGDDGSTLPLSPPCQVLRMDHNVGRATIRNALAQTARYEWLLFLDSDMTLADEHFLEHYLSCEANAVIDGGICIGTGPARNLRYLYEKASEPAHTVLARQRNPYQSFRTTNFMLPRALMLAHPFDERFRYYGYEDVLFGKELQLNGIDICHMDAPLVLTDFESNTVFVSKTEEGLRTLHQFRHELEGYSHLLRLTGRLRSCHLLWLIRCWHFLAGQAERQLLLSGRAPLWMFQLYRLGYFVRLS